ncbi:MAG TPA: HAD family hydrolase [candidate division Zixibacteria bacterium]|nr:HAD family hydrolase [candidate division Zixibacteria bacterium]
MIKCVSFDFDRTLAHVTPLIHHLVPKLLAEKGIHISVEEFKEKCIEMRINLPSHIKESFSRFGTLPKDERNQFLMEYNKARIAVLNLDIEDKEEITELKNWLAKQIFITQKKILYEDVIPTIRKLDSLGMKQYILSGNHSDGIIELLEQAGIIDFFQELITVDKYSPRKVRNFKILLDHSKYLPEDILHIGDDIITDGFGSKGYNINSIIIRRPEQLVFVKENENDFPVIAELSELFNFIK